MNADEKLSFFLELINCNYTLYYWRYDADLRLLGTNWTEELLSDTFFAQIGIKEQIRQHLDDGKAGPLVVEAESNLLWIAGFASDCGRLTDVWLVGPILGGRDTHLIFRRKLDSYDLSVKLRITMHRLFEKIPPIPFNILTQYAVMLHYCLNREKLAPDDVIFLNSDSSVPEKELFPNSTSHAGVWMNEQILCKMFADGDPRYKEALQKSHSLSHGVKTDIGDSLRTQKNNCIVLLTLCSRACISGGLSPDIGYDLNDYYAQRIEDCASITDAARLCAEMMEDYVSRVQEIKRDDSVSGEIRSACEYIKSHLTDPLSIEELAKRTGYTEYYFSHKFKKETGVSVNDFIIREKIEYARLLLSTTTESIQSISDRLAFNSRSYFYTCFQKITGASPTEYRRARRSDGNPAHS